MPSKSPAQRKTMRAACKNPGFAKKVGIPRNVACEFMDADEAKVERPHNAKGRK